jgi:hypothetical protein
MERKEVAEHLGISLSQYSNIENNVSKIDAAKLEKLAALFDMPQDAIKNIDPQKIFNQLNNDSSKGGDMGTMNHHNELNEKLFAQNQKLIEMNEKHFEVIESLIKKLDGGNL